MSQETLVAHRGVYDAVIANGGVDKVPITSSLIHAVRNAHAKYQEAGRKKCMEEKNTKEKVSDKQMKRIAVRELRDKKAAILDNARKSVNVSTITVVISAGRGGH